MTAQELAFDIGGTEGESGVKTLNEIAQIIGYDEVGFKYGSPLEQFLADNSSCVEAILEWIDKQNVQEWNDELSMDEEDYDEEDNGNEYE